MNNESKTLNTFKSNRLYKVTLMFENEIDELNKGWKPNKRFIPMHELPQAVLSFDSRLLPPSPKDFALLFLYPLKGQKV